MFEASLGLYPRGQLYTHSAVQDAGADASPWRQAGQQRKQLKAAANTSERAVSREGSSSLQSQATGPAGLCSCWAQWKVFQVATCRGAAITHPAHDFIFPLKRALPVSKRLQLTLAEPLQAAGSRQHATGRPDGGCSASRSNTGRSSASK